MKLPIRNTVVMLVSGICCSSAWSAVTSCQEIMDKVNAKLEHKGVQDYSLKVVGKDKETSLRVVGTCEGGKKKVIYQKQKQHKKAAEEMGDEAPSAAKPS